MGFFIHSAKENKINYERIQRLSKAKYEADERVRLLRYAPSDFFKKFCGYSSFQGEKFVRSLSDEDLFLFFELTNEFVKIQRRKRSYGSEEHFYFVEESTDEPLIPADIRSKIYSSCIMAPTACRLLDQALTIEYSHTIAAVVDRECRYATHEELLTYLRRFDKLLNKYFFPPAITVHMIAYLLARRASDSQEPICQHMSALIEKANDPNTLEQLTVYWSLIMPITAKRKLSTLLLDSPTSKGKDNAKRALILISENPLAIIEGDQIMGDNINLTGNFRGANISIKSILEDVTIDIANSTNYDQLTKSKLEELVKQLDKVLEEAPPEKAVEAEAVAKTAKMLVETATEVEPNKTMIQITSEGLIKAAENIAKVLPAVLPIAKQIVAALLS